MTKRKVWCIIKINLTKRKEKGGVNMREYLKRLREKSNLSQLKTAQKLDISESYYSLIESGDRQTDMSLSIMQKLAEAFNVPLEYIVEQESKMQKQE